MGAHSARWDVTITGGPSPLRPLRPPVLYRAPLPRTKLEAIVPDGQVTGVLEIQGRTVTDVQGGGGPQATTGMLNVPIRGYGYTPLASPPHRRRGWNWCSPG